MMSRLRKVAESVDRLSLRERLFLLTAVLVMLGGLWEALLAAPLEARERAANERIETIRGRLEQLNQTIAATADGMSEGLPGQIDRLRALRARVAEGEDAVRVYTSDLIDPAQMRLVLEELIRRQRGLKLVSATNLSVRPLFEEKHEDDAGSGIARADHTPSAGDGPKLYQHTLVLTVRGTYLDCLQYLQAVEHLPWQIYWSRLEFSNDAYPLNDIVIELNTLSLDKEWIGV